MSNHPGIDELLRKTIAAIRALDAEACLQEIAVTRLALAGEDTTKARILLAAILEALAMLKSRRAKLQNSANYAESQTKH